MLRHVRLFWELFMDFGKRRWISLFAAMLSTLLAAVLYSWSVYVEPLNAKYGWALTTDDVVTLGQSILKTERRFNEQAGLTRAADRLPDFFRDEPLAPHNTRFDITDQELDSVFPE